MGGPGRVDRSGWSERLLEKVKRVVHVHGYNEFSDEARYGVMRSAKRTQTYWRAGCAALRAGGPRGGRRGTPLARRGTPPTTSVPPPPRRRRRHRHRPATTSTLLLHQLFKHFKLHNWLFTLSNYLKYTWKLISREIRAHLHTSNGLQSMVSIKTASQPLK